MRPYVLFIAWGIVFGTFILVIACLAITDDRNMFPHKGLQPIALGLVVVAIGTCFAFNCGYPINPARDLGPRIFTAMAGWGAEPFSYRGYNWFWVPILGPMCGAAIASFLYSLFIEIQWPSKEDSNYDKPEELVNLQV